MDFDTCYNCGQQGHFASSCPLGLNLAPTPGRNSGNHPPQWKRAPMRTAAEQDLINAEGLALCRAALIRVDNYGPIAHVSEGDHA